MSDGIDDDEDEDEDDLEFPWQKRRVSYATKPSGVEIDLVVYNRCYLEFIAVLVFLLPGLGLLALGAFGSWVWLVLGGLLTAFGVFVGWRLTSVMRSRLMNGDTCPAKVLDVQRGRIAVLADMSLQLDRPIPAVKIVDAPLSRSPFRPFQENQRLTTVSGFRGSLDAEHWSDFEPVVVACATSDAATIERSFKSISQDEWAALNRAIQMLPSLEPGLYFLKATN